MTDEHREAGRILHWGQKMFPATVRLSRIEASRLRCVPEGKIAYRLLSARDVCLAVGFMDPHTHMPWFQPTGATDIELDKPA